MEGSQSTSMSWGSAPWKRATSASTAATPSRSTRTATVVGGRENDTSPRGSRRTQASSPPASDTS